MMKKVEVDNTYCDKKFPKDDLTTSCQDRMNCQIEHKIPQLCRIILRKRIPVPPIDIISILYKSESHHSGERISPVSSNLHLSGMCAKELDIVILAVKEWYNQSPCFWSSLHFQQLVLQTTLIFNRLIWCVCLLD